MEVIEILGIVRIDFILSKKAVCTYIQKSIDEQNLNGCMTWHESNSAKLTL